MPKPLILLHGALGSAENFAPFQRELAPHFTVHSFDFLGHGSSPAQAFSIDSLAAQLEAFIQAEQLQQADIFGYSMGGYVALSLAQRAPDLLGTIICLGTKLAWSQEYAEAEVKNLQPDKILEKVPRFAAYLSKLHGDNEWSLLLQHTAAMMLQLGAEPVLSAPRSRAITNTVHLLRGEHDKMVTQEETADFAAVLPSGKWHTLPSTPHQIERVNTTLLTQKIRSLLL